MSQPTFASMSDTAFEQLIDRYIERTAADETDVPGDIFFDLLLERMVARSNETITLAVVVDNDQVTILPDREIGDLVIRGNEIFIGGRRLIFQLAQRTQ